MDQSELGRLVDSYQGDLDQLTRTQSQALLDAWKAGYRQVEQDLTRVLDKIDQAIADGETVSPSWLLQRDRLMDVYTAVARQQQAVADTLGQVLPASEQTAARMGDAHAAALISELDPYGVAAQFGGVNAPAVRNITAATAKGGPLDKVLAGFADPGPMQDRIRAELTSGIITGRNPRVTAQRIRQASATGTLARAETIARTETLRAYRNAQQQAYDASPVVDGWTWLSAQNARTCAACWVMTGSWHPTTERLAGHVNCRCRMIPRTPSWESLGLVGLPDTNPQVPPGPETLAQLHPDELVHILGPGKYERYRAGELALSDMVTETDSPVWGKSVRVATIPEALDNAKARKAGHPTPGDVPYGPVSAPMTPSKAQPAPPATTPAPKPVPPISPTAHVVGTATPTGRPWDEPVPKFATVAEAETWLRDRWGTTYDGKTRTIGFGKIHVSAAQSAAAELDYLMKAYPRVAEKVLRFGSSITIDHKSTSALAYANPATGTIAWKQGWLAKPKWADVNTHNKETGFHSSGMPGGSIHHEWGHHMHFLIERIVNPSTTHPAWSEAPDYLKAQLNPIIDAVLGTTTGKGLNDLATRKRVGEEVSRYGATDVWELIAEAFAEHSMARRGGPPARPLSRAIGEWLEQQIDTLP